MNKAVVLGNLTRDPELRTTQSGISVCTFTVAVNRRFTNQQTGEREADFIPVVVWRQQADNCAKYLRKGSKVCVCGAIQTRTYDGQDGQKRYATEIVADEVQFVSGNPGAEGGSGGAAPMPSNAPPALTETADDDLPF